MIITLLTEEISNYHNARYRACAARLDAFSVVSVVNEADFKEFMFGGEAGYRVEAIYGGRAAYRAAVRSGAVGRRTTVALESLAPDLVGVAGWSCPESIAAILWAKRRGRRVVMMSDSQELDAPRSTHREVLKSRVVRACDSALVGGGPHRDYVIKLGMPADRVFLGYAAVDNAHFETGANAARENADTLRNRHGLPKRYLLASSRFIPKKNLTALIAAYAAAARRRPDAVHLVVLGDGRERPAVEAAIAAHGVAERVHLQGFRDYDTLPIYYGLADGFVHVSLSEQWGLVINEAAASGLPLVVSRPCGAAAQLVEDGVNGFLVDPANLESMTTAICALMDLSLEARRRMGEASRRIVANWGPERFASGLLSAAQAALRAPVSRLAPRDALLLKALSRITITNVE